MPNTAKIKLRDKVESAHQWINDDGKRKSVVLRFDAGEEVGPDHPQLKDVQDWDRAAARLVKLEHAETIA